MCPNKGFEVGDGDWWRTPDYGNEPLMPASPPAWHPNWPTTIQPNTTTWFPRPEKDEFENEDQKDIADLCDELKEFLLAKNRKYGSSALNPSRIFSRSDSVEQIKVRIDDKLTRLQNQQDDEDEDVVWDLLGYLVLLRLALKRRDALQTSDLPSA